MSEPDILKEAERLMKNVSKIGTDIALEQVQPAIERGFNNFIDVIQNVVNEENINKVLELKDTLMNMTLK